MSHYTTLPTQIVDEQALLLALADLGFAGPQVERFETAQPLYGYHGDVRPERAHLIIRRKYIGRSSNDIGFVRDDVGRYHAIISDYDRSRFNATWLDRLHQRYAYHATMQELTLQGFTLIEETAQDGSLHLTLRRA